MLRRYIESRRDRRIEPVASFDLYKELDQQLASQLHGVTAANGMTVTGHSVHSIERVIGTRYYTNDKGQEVRRNGVSISDIQEALINGRIKPEAKEFATIFATGKCRVILSQDGNIVTVIPQ